MVYLLPITHPQIPKSNHNYSLFTINYSLITVHYKLLSPPRRGQGDKGTGGQGDKYILSPPPLDTEY